MRVLKVVIHNIMLLAENSYKTIGSMIDSADSEICDNAAEYCVNGVSHRH